MIEPQFKLTPIRNRDIFYELCLTSKSSKISNVINLFSFTECSTDHYITVSTATESIQFDGRAVSLGSGTPSIHVPTSPAQAPSTETPTEISLSVLRSESPASQNSSPAPTDIQTGTISPSTTDKRSSNDGQDVKSITQLLQQSAQQLFKTQLDMPPPTSPTMAPSPRKRRRKREDPQSCLTNSEVRMKCFKARYAKCF